MKIRPRRRGVVIRPDEKDVEQVSPGGIIMPQNQWSMHPDVIFGTVETVGADCRELKEGMRILVGRFAGVKLDDEQMLVDEEDIIAEVTE